MDNRILYDTGTKSPDGSHSVKNENVSVDETFEVILKGNPQNGYMWYANTDKDVLSSMGETMEPLPRYTGTRQHFLFKPLREGEATIEFVYKRSWEDTIHTSVVMDISIA